MIPTPDVARPGTGWPTCTVERAVDVLNRALDADPVAMSKLIGNRVKCNAELAGDFTIQAGQDDPSGEYRVGLLGILNGLFGVDGIGYGAISAIVADGTGGQVVAFELRVPAPDPASGETS